MDTWPTFCELKPIATVAPMKHWGASELRKRDLLVARFWELDCSAELRTYSPRAIGSGCRNV